MSATKTTPAAGRAGDAAVMLPRIENRILVVRQHKVIIDADLALLYGVPTNSSERSR